MDLDRGDTLTEETLVQEESALNKRLSVPPSPVQSESNSENEHYQRPARERRVTTLDSKLTSCTGTHQHPMEPY